MLRLNQGCNQQGLRLTTQQIPIIQTVALSPVHALFLLLRWSARSKNPVLPDHLQIPEKRQ